MVTDGTYVEGQKKHWPLLHCYMGLSENVGLISKGCRPCRRPRKRICKGSLAEVNVRKVPHVLWTMQLFEKGKQYLAKYTWCRWLIGLEQMPQCSNFIKGWRNRQEWRDSWQEACSEPNNTSMCIWAERRKTKLLKALKPYLKHMFRLLDVCLLLAHCCLPPAALLLLQHPFAMKKRTCRAGKHHGTEGRNNALQWQSRRPNVPSGTLHKTYVSALRCSFSS